MDKNFGKLKNEGGGFKPEDNYLEAYKSYHERVLEIKKQISEGKNMKLIPGYLHAGFYGVVFFVDDTHTKIIKLYEENNSHNNDKGENEISALMLAKDIPNTSHLIAYSYEDSAYVLDYIPGKNLEELPREEVPDFTDKELVDLLGTIITLYKKGIIIDPRPTNFIYNPKDGFSVIDFTIDDKTKSITDKIQDLPFLLSRRARNEKDDNGHLGYMMHFPVEGEFEDLAILKQRIPKLLLENFPEFYNEHIEEFVK